MNIEIKKALPSDAQQLTRIAYAAKRHWGYAEEYYTIWANELTVTESYITKNTIEVAQVDGQAVGFYAITEAEDDLWSGDVFVKKGYYLDHLFIDPLYIGKGIGTQLVKHALSYAKMSRIDRLRLFSDPNARGFYEKMGATYICDSPSSIPDRMLPIFELISD